MTVQLQLRRGTNVENAAFLGAEGELTYDTTNKNLRIHDHTTLGGITIDKAADVVHKTGNESISGVKTFSSEPVLIGTANLNLKHTNITKGTAPTSNTYWGVEATANPASSSDTSWQGRRIGKLEWCLTTSNVNTVTLSALKNEAASTDQSAITLKYDTTNNKATAVAPIPDASNSTSDNYIATTGWVNNPNGSTNVVHRTGAETISGVKTFNDTIQGIANKALWADLAECYQTDQKYPTGTLITFGGKKDITIAKVNCNGVISDKPGYLLDYELKDSQPVALVGKTPIRVLGKVKKFDRIVLSTTPGVGKVQTTSDETPIGIALENSNAEEEKLVLCVTKFNIF